MTIIIFRYFHVLLHIKINIFYQKNALQEGIIFIFVTQILKNDKNERSQYQDFNICRNVKNGK